jgi:hypothetical protein
VSDRRGVDKYLPTSEALDVANEHDDVSTPTPSQEELLSAVVRRFAINTVSVFDWLTGTPTAEFDVSPLRELSGLTNSALCDAVRPFMVTLKKQYRMHSTLSRVPREVFYFGEALQDGLIDDPSIPRVLLDHVETAGMREEHNAKEVERVTERLEQLHAHNVPTGKRSEVMLITPYRAQEAKIREALAARSLCKAAPSLSIEVCTLDRCQGREADYVIISLVRSRATTFFDMPKRWNVALTRAKSGLVIIGDIDAYLEEARRARAESRQRGGNPQMSVLARVLEAYSHQASTPDARRVAGGAP